MLTAWIVGKTDRFRAAVVGQAGHQLVQLRAHGRLPAPSSATGSPAPPWEHPEHYLKRSPLSLVGNVKTPTMLLTGEEDYRTPISESEQFYQALKLRKVDTLLVRIPEASHDITDRPSRLVAKTDHILAWFARYRSDKPAAAAAKAAAK